MTENKRVCWALGSGPVLGGLEVELGGELPHLKEQDEVIGASDFDISCTPPRGLQSLPNERRPPGQSRDPLEGLYYVPAGLEVGGRSWENGRLCSVFCRCDQPNMDGCIAG